MSRRAVLIGYVVNRLKFGIVAGVNWVENAVLLAEA